MRRVASIMATSITAITMLAGCPNREVSKVDIDQIKQERREIPVEINRAVDILFVIDDSDSMREEQDSLAANFDDFIGVLQQIEGGLPDVHIGVVSTNMGANAAIQLCDNSDNGAFHFTPSADCPQGDGFALDGTFLVDVADETQADGRRRNYAGQLQDAFSCIAKLGTQGCGFEMPLESMRQGLLNAPEGFLRPEAFLAVIFIADEDDCSTRDYGMFDVNETAIDGPLGPLDSFRCFEFGVECSPDASRNDVGAREECVPRENSPYMFSVQEYVDFLTELKGGTYPIIVAGIVGNPEPIEVSTRTIPATGEIRPTLTPSCESSSGVAFPAVRLGSFLGSFPKRNTVTTICNEDLSDALNQVALLLANVVGNPCLDPGVDLNQAADGVQHECQVSDVQFDLDDAPLNETPLAQCKSETPDASELPCWYLTYDSTSCTPDKGQPIELVIERGDTAPPAGTRAVLHCVTK